MVMELLTSFDAMGDEHKMFLVFRAAHNGLNALRIDLSPIRMSCFNQNTLITNTAKASWSITHTLNHDLAVVNAEQALSFAAEYERAYAELAAKLAGIEISPERGLMLLKVSMIKRAQVGKVIEGAHANWMTSTTITDGQRANGWGLLQGVTEFMDHVLRRDNPNAQFEAVMTGENARVRNNLCQNLLKLAA
jgi:hypothetical protein